MSLFDDMISPKADVDKLKAGLRPTPTAATTPTAQPTTPPKP